MIERYTPDGQLVRTLPSMVDLRVEDETEDVVDFRSDWGNQLPDGFEMEGMIVTVVGLVETDMDKFDRGHAYVVRLHLPDDPPGLEPWGWFQGNNSVVVKKILGFYGKKGVKPIRGMIVRRQGNSYPTPYWDLVDPNTPYEEVATKAKKGK